MHANSPSSLSYEKDRSNVTKPNSSSTVTNAKSLPNGALAAHYRPSGLPDEFEEYLTITSKPSEIFVTLQDSRERRLRLLLRRFTNQIQYGCKNPLCDVTTCLSYRKRHATTPLRPYSDVVARALAWRCVEEYADATKVHENQLVAVKRRNKIKRHQQNTGAELCWNEPVVPWYDDGIEAARKIKGSRHRHVAASPVGHNDCAIRRSSSSTPTNSLPNPSTDQTLSIGEKLSSKQNGSQYKELSMGNGSVEPPVAHPRQADTSTDARDVEERRSHTTRRRHVAFAEPSQSEVHAQRPGVKDTASFTQTLYDTFGMKQFDDPLSLNHTVRDSIPVGSTEACSDPDEANPPCMTPPVTHKVSPGSTATIPRIITLKILPLSAILWLRSTLPYDEYLSSHRDLSITTNHNDLSPFIRQSLHFCLSRPLILLNSAKTWRFVHQQPHKMDQEKRTKVIKHLVSAERSILQSTHEKDLPQPGGIMLAFGMLVALTSIPEVLGHLFAALQHAYILPPWFEQIEKKEGSASINRRKADAVNTKSQKVDDASQDSNVITHTHDKMEDGSAFLKDAQVAQICVLVTLALQLVLALKPQSFTLSHAAPSKDPKSGKDVREQYLQSQKSGLIFPHANLYKAWSKESSARSNYQAYTARLDMMDLSSFQRLLDGLADMISHRMALTETKNAYKNYGSGKPGNNVINLFISEILTTLKAPHFVKHQQTAYSNLVDLMRSVVLRRWDRNAVIKRRGPVSGALELLAALYRNKTDLGIPSSEFEWPFIADAFDEMDMPAEWIDFRADSTQTHILSYPFLFEAASLVKYFRSINSMMMKKSYDYASAVFANAQQFIQNMGLNVYGAKEVLVEMRPNMAKFFVLTMRREHMLQDAIDQIWRRQKQELTRPLKVRLGKDEGEDGLDHGGVQVEFFRLVFAEALNPDYGMFTIDERTLMTWFRPGSVEPLYKFEALGILMSLAVYNGITLPITFPLAFYRKLLGLKVKTLQQIADGWPDLARGLQQLLDWQDGDVGQVIARTYEFSYEEFGTTRTVDMTKVGRDDLWPPPEQRQSNEKSKTASFRLAEEAHQSLTSEAVADTRVTGSSSGTNHLLPTSDSTNPTSIESVETTTSPSDILRTTGESEAPLVTNSNRERYVRDYVYWLAHKSIAAQFASFSTGFFACLDRSAVSIFTPEHLKSTIEGHQHIDIDGLQATATYEDYRPIDEVIQWFWQVVRDMSPDRHRKLLEFVTACDRVPVNGIASIVFIVQRNGDGDDRLPSSSTCYGRLLLPRYSTREVLREKLNKAIDNSVGFGSL